MAAKSRVTNESIAHSAFEDNKDKINTRLKKTAGSVAIAAATVGGVGGGLSLVSAQFGTAVANAERCYVVGGAADGSGQGALNAFRAQGQLNSCWEGVETVQYPGNFWPSAGPLKNRDELPPAAADLSNRLNNTPDWQRKRVLGFSEGAMVAARASQQTTANNVKFELSGGPEGRTGIFNSALYNVVPLVKPIAEGIIGIDSSTQLRERPGIEIERRYSKGDMFANAQPQGLDPFSLISGADMMLRIGAHSVETQTNPVFTEFVDGDGIKNVVFDDRSPFTRAGNVDPAVMNPNPAPQIPPLFYGLPPVPLGPPGPAQVAPAPVPMAAAVAEVLPPPPAPVLPPAPEVLPPPPAPADVLPPVRSPFPSFWGEQPCIAPDGSHYYTPGDAPC